MLIADKQNVLAKFGTNGFKELKINGCTIHNFNDPVDIFGVHTNGTLSRTLIQQQSFKIINYNNFV